MLNSWRIDAFDFIYIQVPANINIISKSVQGGVEETHDF